MTLQPQQVWLALEPVDMRLGIEVQQALSKAPCDGSAYAFCNVTGNCPASVDASRRLG